MTKPLILIVEDDPDLAHGLARGLGRAGYDCVAEVAPGPALARIAAGGLAAAIVDVMLGAESGLDLVRQARALGVQVPMLMLSARAEVGDRAEGLEAGADDYVVKPFAFDELLARLEVQTRRFARRGAVLDRAGWTLRAGGQAVALTEREFALLSLLAAHAGEPLSRGHLFDTLWQGQGASAINVVDVYVGQLRRKLGPAEAFGFEIKTLRNRGFMLAGTPPKAI